MRDYLSRKGVPFEERNTGENKEYERQLQSLLGYTTYPVIVSEEDTVIGYDPDGIDNLIAGGMDDPVPWLR